MESYWLHTLGCPKNQVDGEKLSHRLRRDGLREAESLDKADLLVVNTCAFIEAARQESIDMVLDVSASRRPGSRLVVTGCLAERYGPELAEALPEVDLVAGFGQPLHVGSKALSSNSVPVHLRPRAQRSSAFDLLELERGDTNAPWAYVKIAEGCDRRCGFCAIPSFRGDQRSRRHADILREVAGLAGCDDPDDRMVREIVLVAQDLASYGRDRSKRRTDLRRASRQPAEAPIVQLVRDVSAMVERTRLLYLYPSSLTDPLVDAIIATGVPYFDLSLQHVSRPLLAKMRRWGDGDRFLRRIDDIRNKAPDAALRSSFILGYPGETEEDHDQLLAFLQKAQLDWAGFFPFSSEEGTHARDLPKQVPSDLALERLRECAAVQDAITERRRRALVGSNVEVLVDRRSLGRTFREAPEIDGLIHLPENLEPGSLLTVRVTGAVGPDLWAEPERLELPA